MDTKDVTRKLRAILNADVQGYSRLMGDDEVATVETITEYRETLTSLVNQYNGRVVDSPGDNILAEFASVVDAVQCAVEIQNILKAKNEDLPENRRMIFRIGVNLGDVIQEGDRIYGDGVNIAARLEALAEPGGICISKTAFDQIETKLPLGYEYLGDQTVKNIARPVGAYRVLMDPKITVAGEVEKGKAVPVGRRKAILAGGVALILVVIAGLIWHFYFRHPSIEPASVEKMAFPLPDKPSIAVLPFVNMSDDPKQEFFSDGITENIITALSKTPRLFVIARNSTFVYKGKPVKTQQVAEDLGVRYVLEGSVRKSENKVRVTAQLIDALKGTHLWAEKYDRDLKDIFAIQDDITREIIVSLKVKLTEGEQARIWSRGTENTKALEKAFESLEHFRRFNHDDVILCRKKAEEALTLDPNYPFAVHMLAWSHLIEVWMGWSKSPGESLKKAVELGQKTLALNENNADAHALLGSIYVIQKQWDKAIEKGKRAVELSPSSEDVNALLGITLNKVGKHKEAISLFKKAIRLNPITPNWYYHNLGAAQILAGNYQEAITSLKRVIEKNPKHIPARFYLIVAYSLSNQDKEAKIQVEEYLKLRPSANIEGWKKRATFKNETDIDLFVNALRKVGFPETPLLPLPDKPAIAVLPFANISGDPKKDYLSDGITEQIISALSKTPKLFVIARNSVFTYKGKPVMVQQVSKDLGVRYVLVGSVQKSGDRIRITAQLIDAKTRNHVWTEKFDRDLKDIFALQDDIAMNIITALQLKLTEGEQTRIYRRHTNNIEAYLNLLKGREHMYRHTKQGFLVAKELLKEAIALDPNYTTPYEFLGHIHLMEAANGWSPSPGESFNQVFELSQKILELDSSNAPVHGLFSEFYYVKKQHGKAISEAEKFIALDPNDADAYAVMGLALFGAGKFKDSISMFDKAIALNPIPPTWYLNSLGWATFHTGLVDEANAVFRKLIISNPRYSFAYAGLGCTLIAVGKPEEAVVELDKALNLNPDSPGWFIGNRAVALVGIGKPEEAITTMQDLVSRRPDDIDGYRLFSPVLRLEGRHEEALQMAKNAVSLGHGPLDSVALGMSYFMLEQYDQAIAQFRESIKLWPDYWRAYVLLAAAYSLAGRMEDARAEIAEVLRINPKSSLEDIAKNGYVNYKEADKERFSNALRKAGLK